jgi:hypothetical protein
VEGKIKWLAAHQSGQEPIAILMMEAVSIPENSVYFDETTRS